MIKLSDSYAVGSDELQFILYKVGVNHKQNTPTYKAVGYYTTLTQALTDYMNRIVIKAMPAEMQELSDAVNMLTDVMRKAVKEMEGKVNDN